MTDPSTAKERLAEFYEHHHHTVRKYDGYLHGDEERRDLLVRLIGRGGRVLDVGCRSGNLTKYYCEGNEVVGVDIDREAVELFRSRLGLESHWLDIDHDSLPFPDASFDVVVCTELLEHVRFPSVGLAEMRRVLKVDGRLVGSVPNSTRLRNRWRFLTGELYDTDPSHLRSFSPYSLRGTLAAEFETVEILPVSGHLIGGGRHGGVRILPWLPYGFRLLLCANLVFVCS